MYCVRYNALYGTLSGQNKPIGYWVITVGFICLSVWHSDCLSIYLGLSILPSIYPPIHPPVRPSIHSFVLIHSFIYLVIKTKTSAKLVTIFPRHIVRLHVTADLCVTGWNRTSSINSYTLQGALLFQRLFTKPVVRRVSVFVVQVSW